MAKSLLLSKPYRDFVRQRNRALDDLLLRTQLVVSAVTQSSILRTKDLIASRYPRIKMAGIFTLQGKEILRSLEQDLARHYHLASLTITEAIRKQRRLAYMISYSGEAEAIGQALGKAQKYTLTKDKIRAQEMSDSFSGGDIASRIQLTFNRLLRKVMNAVELSATSEEDLDTCLERVEKTLPKQKAVKVTRRVLDMGKKLQEADRGEDLSPDMSFGMIDEETWEEWVELYKDEYVPSWRGPEEEYRVRTPAGSEERATVYAWELEQEITQDFVYQVRMGQHEAAKENGIEDYIWIAIVDDRTDDCCLWRDGLTTSEIEKSLKTDRSDDHCQAIVPPAHFNCRCALAPAVEELPDREASNQKDFEAWLES